MKPGFINSPGLEFVAYHDIEQRPAFAFRDLAAALPRLSAIVSRMLPGAAKDVARPF